MRKETRLFQISFNIISLHPGRRVERSIMTTNSTFVKLANGTIINISSIDGIFPDNNRAYNGGWVVQLNGKDFHVDDIQPILDAINIPSSKTAFDPDKRIRPANPTAAVPATESAESTFAQKSMQVKLLVTEFNKDKLYPLRVNIDNINNMISVWDGSKKLLIKNGIVIEDTLGDYSRLNKIKTDIIKLFV